MSLISQKDRELVLKALEYYKQTVPTILEIRGDQIIGNPSEKEMMELNTLIGWIKLEYSKHDNQSMVQ